MTFKHFLQFATAISFAVTLTGCGTLKFTGPTGPVTVTSTGLSGLVHGGRQPISGATIALYQSGTTGYGMGATLINSTTSSSTGMFNFPAFTCTAGTQIYITSTGGDPYGNGENNVAATLMAGLVSCNNIASLHKVEMDEVTTVGTVWALAPFMNGLNMGAPTTNQTGLANALLDVATLVNVGTGFSPGANLPAGTTVPTAEINTLANALVSCVNSVDNSTTTSTACANLFTYATPPGGNAPSDTVGAAINIARHPGQYVSQIIAAGGTIEAFQPVIATANDLSIAILYSGSGITSPTSLATDAAGNIWVTNSSANTVTELSHTGVPATGTPYMPAGLNGPRAIAIDASGNAWIPNGGASTLTELSSSGANAIGSPFSGGGLSTPNAVAIDLSGNVWVSNSGNTSVSKFSSTGIAISGTSGYTAPGLSSPIGVAIDPH